jgi:predicted O-linked N-acetylglucosamine transferase (SPINDLY family)
MLGAQHNLGTALSRRGQLDWAITVLRGAIAGSPDQENSDGFTNLLFALYHHPDYDSKNLLQETQNWARRQRAFPRRQSAHRETRPDRRLRVGYLSPFFSLCADAHFILPLFTHHDRGQFEVFGYSAVSNRDQFTERMKSSCDHWSDIHRLGAEEAIELIRNHEIDILVNISAPADRCQMILASRSAPIQINWLAFASATTGLATVDYRISDPFVDPLKIGEPDCYSEETIHLPETAWCYDPLIDLLSEPLPVNPPPSLDCGSVTFGSLNRFSKINPAVIATWAEILRSVPGARLRMMAVAGTARQAVVGEFQRLGIERSRIAFIDRLSREEYLRQYHGIDIMLDTFPYSGHTTVFDSLWMGVPTVTCLGRTSVGRVAAGALQNLNLSDLIGPSPREYAQIAVRLASDPRRLQELRSTLRERMQASPLMDAPRFARHIEAAYRQIWRRRRENPTGSGSGSRLQTD